MASQYNWFIYPPHNNDTVETKKSKSFLDIKKRLNMHISLHYVAQAREYAVPDNCNVLAG